MLRGWKVVRVFGSQADCYALQWAGVNGSMGAIVMPEPMGRDVEAVLSRAAAWEALLRRLLQWDHLDGSADGPYWRHEIENAIGVRYENGEYVALKAEGS